MKTRLTVNDVEYLVQRERTKTYRGEPDDKLIFVEWCGGSTMQLDDGQTDAEAVATAIRQCELYA